MTEYSGGSKTMHEKDKEYLTVQQVAELLQVSARTVRRRIKSGKLEAEKHPGPYGDQWLLPSEQFDDISTGVTDIVPVEQTITADQFREEVRKAVQEEVSELKEEVEGLRTQLEARDKKLMEAIRKKQENTSLWERIRSWFR